MKNRFILLLLLLFLITGCTIDPYQKSKYGEMSIEAWFSNKNLGNKRKDAENIDAIVSKKCEFLESKSNKYVFLCEIVYKEKGETVIPLSKNSKIKVYAVFIKESGNKFDYKVYNSSSEKNVWKNDKYLNY